MNTKLMEDKEKERRQKGEKIAEQGKDVQQDARKDWTWLCIQ